MRKYANNLLKPSIVFLCLVATYTASYAQCTVVGWASQNGGVTGGGTATPTVVTTYDQFKTAVTSASVKVVHVSGTITVPPGGNVSLQDQSGKTIFGLPGSKLVSTDQTAANSGIMYMKRCSNIILQNLTFEGPGAYDVDGKDNLTIDNSTNIWVDHCDFQDGTDGNLDVKNAADYVSITWTKFGYNKAPIPGGPGGSDDHRFTNLFGSGDSVLTDRGKLRVTLYNCWWAPGCKARMPRVRFGKVHIANSYYNSTASTYCVQAGSESDLLIENNVFENVKYPIDQMNGSFTAITERNNIYTNITGTKAGKGTAFTPPYTLSLLAASEVKTIVMASAGATLTSANCGTNANKNPTVNITSPANNATFSAPASITIDATASDADGSISKVEFYNGTTLLGSDNSTSYSYTWTNVAAGTYTITAKAYDNTTGVATSSAVSVVVSDGTAAAATLTKKGAGSSSQTIDLGNAIASFGYDWTNASTVSITGLPTGIQTTIDNTTKNVTISGTPTQTGIFKFTVSTVGGSPEATKTGTITVNSVTGIDEPSDNSSWQTYPNPTTGSFTIEKEGGYAEAKVYNSSGVLVVEQKIKDKFVFGQNLEAGVYTLSIVENGTTKKLKLIKK